METELVFLLFFFFAKGDKNNLKKSTQILPFKN